MRSGAHNGRFGVARPARGARATTLDVEGTLSEQRRDREGACCSYTRRPASQGRRRRIRAGCDGHRIRLDLPRALPLPAQPYLADGRPAHHPTAEWGPCPPPNKVPAYLILFPRPPSLCLTGKFSILAACLGRPRRQARPRLAVFEPGHPASHATTASAIKPTVSHPSREGGS